MDAPLNAALFITDEIAERTVELGDGTKHVLYFKQLPNTVFERYAIWTNSADEDVEASAAARLVALGLCGPDGKQVLTNEQAIRLKPQVLRRMLTNLLEINGYGKAKETAGNA